VFPAQRKFDLVNFSQIPVYDATPKQKLLISRLCKKLKIKTPIEESLMSKGEAGRMIRQLSMQVKAARR